jgi:hypothetical protein
MAISSRKSKVGPIARAADPDRPISALLSQVLVAYTVEFDNEFERQMAEAGCPGAILSLTVWSNLMRYVETDGISVRELAARTRAQGNQENFMLGCLERWRYISLKPAFDDTRPVRTVAHRRAGKELREGWGSGRGIRPEWIIRPTTGGRKATEIWPTLFEAIEQRWRVRFGETLYSRLQDSLLAVVDQLELELPFEEPSPTLGKESYGPKTTRAGERLALPTLLSQLLLAFRVEFDEQSHTPLELCANTIRVLSDKPVPVGQIARLTGSSPEMTNVGWRLKPFVAVGPDPSATSSRGKVARLTPLGLKAQATYHRLTGQIEKSWQERYGKKEVQQLRECLLEIVTLRGDEGLAIAVGMVPPEGVVRGGKQWPALGRRDVGAAAKQRMRDMVEQTKAYTQDPAGALPHYPLWDMNRGFGP